jgi:protease I
MHKPLSGCKIVILVGNGFEEIQMTDCQRALAGAGAIVKTVSTAPGLVNGWNGKGWGHYYPVDQQVAETLAADFDMLLLPSGERSLAKLLETAHTLRIIRGFRDSNKPVAAIGSGVDLLVAADRLAGVSISINPSSIEKATAIGAQATGDAITQDGFVLTARDDADLAAFIQQMLELFASSDALKRAA